MFFYFWKQFEGWAGRRLERARDLIAETSLGVGVGGGRAGRLRGFDWKNKAL